MFKKPNSGAIVPALTVPLALLTIGTALFVTDRRDEAIARRRQNELRAIATLRTLAHVQKTFQSAGFVDTNADGVGEFGYFGELAGTDPLRQSAGVPPGPVTGNPSTDLLSTPLLAPHFGDVLPGAASEGVIYRDGYIFQIWLPGSGSVPPGIPESVSGGLSFAPWPGSDNAEQIWCAYAWPQRHGGTGTRTFFVHSGRDVLATFGHPDAPYQSALRPHWSAAFSSQTLTSEPSVNGVPGTAMDQSTWKPVN